MGKLLVLVFLVAMVGCQSPTMAPLPTIPAPLPFPVGDSVTASKGEVTIEQEQLHIERAFVTDVSTVSALLVFSSNIPCTAVVRVLEGEYFLTQYSLEGKVKEHRLSISSLKPSKSYTLIIEATGGSSDRKVLSFSTLPVIDVVYSSGGGGWFPVFGGSAYVEGSVVVSVKSCDGAFEEGVWTVSAYPGETKGLVLLVSNGTSYSKEIKVSWDVMEYPEGGLTKVTLEGDPLLVYAHSVIDFSVSLKVARDAPLGGYRVQINLGD